MVGLGVQPVWNRECQMFRWLRWRRAKQQLALPRAWKLPGDIDMSVSHEKHRRQAEDFPPNTKGYDKLATVWDDFSAGLVVRYWLFLPSVEDYYGYPIESVLDLACGTGFLTRRLAGVAQRVVGLDASGEMLSRARDRTVAKHVRYVQADFRDFSVGETFDTVVCAGDSLNYVETQGELVDVLLAVRLHLRPGGFFVFDTLGDKEFRLLAGTRTVISLSDNLFQLYYFYDEDLRVSESRVVTDGAVERHRRVPIEEEDVRNAARASGLELLEHFAWRKFLVGKPRVGRQFYLLRRAD